MKNKSNKIWKSSVRRIKNNDGGFSLVELIIAIAILSIVGIMCGMLMSRSVDLFSRTNTRETLQYKSQLALIQMKEYCASAIGVAPEVSESSTKLHIVTKSKSGTKTMYSFVYTKNDNPKLSKIDLVESEFHIVGNNAVVTETSVQPLVSGVADFSFEINNKTGNSERASSIEITLKVTNGTKAYTKNYFISMKANPIYIKDAAGSSLITETLAKNIESLDGNNA